MVKNRLFLSFFVVILASIFGFYFAGNDGNLTGVPDPVSTSISTEVDLIAGWTAGANIPQFATFGAGATYVRNDTAWLYSFSNSPPVNYVQRYNVRTNVWTTVAPLMTAFDRGCAATLRDSIYIFGGANSSGAYVNMVQVYNIQTNTWTYGTPLPGVLGWAKACSYQDSLIYIAGGYDGTSAFDRVLLYNRFSGAWRTSTPLPLKRCGGGFSRSGDTLVYIGGADSVFNLYNNVYRGVISQSDRTVITWTSGAAPPPPFTPGIYRTDASPWGSKGIILANGSTTTGFTGVVGCAIYSPGANVWTSQPNMLAAATYAHTGSVQLSGGVWKLIIAGGYNNTYLSNTQIFTDNLNPSGWTNLPSGTTNNLRAIDFINTTSGYVAGENGTFLGTTNGGLNWQNRSILNEGINAIDFTDFSTGFAACNSGKIYMTTNSGFNWSPPSILLPSPYYTVTFPSPTTGYSAGPPGYIFKTINSGLNWVQSTTGFTDTVYTSTFIDVNTGYIAGRNGKISRTTTGGVNWQPQYTQDFTTRSFRSIKFTDYNTGMIVGDNSAIYRTVNGGTNWNIVSNTGMTGNLRSLFFASSTNGYITGDAGRIYYTSNGGLNWSLQSTNTNNNLNAIFFPSALTGYAVGDNGTILKTTTGGLTAVNNPVTNIPDKFSLSQNYPNPFNPVTTIKYGLPKYGNTKLIVYDLLGRVAAILVDEFKDAGTYEVIFDATDLSSGVYFYTFESGSYKETKKMLMIK